MVDAIMEAAKQRPDSNVLRNRAEDVVFVVPRSRYLFDLNRS